MTEAQRGSFDVCPVCGWEDDEVQFSDPDYPGGANEVSLNRARENFRSIGAVSDAARKMVRDPVSEEMP